MYPKTKISFSKNNEQGAALAVALIIMAILAVICATVFAFASTEIRITSSEMQRTQTFYATASSIELMTNNFNNLFRKKMKPTADDLKEIADTKPTGLIDEGFTFEQTLEENAPLLAKLRQTQGLSNTVYPRINLTEGPFSGLYSTVVPYKITSTGTKTLTGTQVKLEREFNNYLIPLFQFGLFSDNDLEFAPGVLLTFNGRVHANGNLYVSRNSRFLSKVTTAGEMVRAVFSNGEFAYNTSVSFRVNGVDIPSTVGSVLPSGTMPGGPNIQGTSAGQRGYNPTSPLGVFNPNWESVSTQTPALNDKDKFAGMLLTRSTGAVPLKMPLQLGGASTIEIIKRNLPSDDEILSSSRYHTKAQIRILLDDENAGNGSDNAAGIPAGKGLLLSQFTPMVLDNGSALRRVSDLGGYNDSSSIQQNLPISGTQKAMTVRGTKISGETVGSNYIPPGSGVVGKILIEIVKPDGTTVDVTREVLSMGVTQLEPNTVVSLQRPIWAGYVQGSRDRSNNGFDLVSLSQNSQAVADGEIDDPTSYFDSAGFIKTTLSVIDPETTVTREASPSQWQNQIVPINSYNVREGWFNNLLSKNNIYERGMTSIVEINMKNLARWVDGIYDDTLLKGTNAVSTNIQGSEGYVLYVSDRRGDKIKAEYLKDGSAYLSTNGNVDNEDFYGMNNVLDPGEDLIDFGWNSDGTSKKGTLQKDVTELPDSGTVWSPTSPTRTRADTLLRWNNPSNYFRRAVRLFNGEKLSLSASSGKLSPTKGITIATENMLYIWGSFNTNGVSQIPTSGSTLNDGSYLGAQVPASLICDAFFPLSKTWFDGSSLLYPHSATSRVADAGATTEQQTAVRAAIIAGTTKSALNGNPGRDSAGDRNSGGTHNFPRLSENWGNKAWSYTGSFVPFYNSAQAIAPYEFNSYVIYVNPRRNWSFDSTFLDASKLPPGTPFFQYVQATGFRQNVYN